MLLWRQGSAIEDKSLTIALLRWKLTTRDTAMVKAQGTIDTQKAVIESLLQSGILVDIPIGLFICTAYEASEVSCGKWADGITSEGVPVGLGIAAADHRILPPGTILYVHKLCAYFIVMDKGGAIKGNRLDLYTIDVRSARQFGILESRVSIIRGG